MVLVIMGVSGAGKSTVARLLAQRLGWPMHDADDHHAPESIEKMRRGVALDDRDRWPWLDALSAVIRRCTRDGSDAVLACSALKQEYRDRLLRDPHEVRLVYLRAPFELAHDRLTRRHHPFMNPILLRSQYDALEEPAQAMEVDAGLPPDEIVDRICASAGLKPPT